MVYHLCHHVLTSLCNLHLPFPTQPQTAKANSLHHSLSAQLPFSLGTSQEHLCRSSLSWSCQSSCWRSGAVFQQLASAQLRLMGSCSHFEGKLSRYLDGTSNLCSFSVHQLQLLVIIQFSDVAMLRCKPLTSRALFCSPALLAMLCLAFGEMTHICCSSSAVSCPPQSIEE